ncbi:MAG: diguanylate cyclase domain-containing protein [Acidimicrobiales bacterium]
MADASPAALVAPDRCALQLHVAAEGPAEALLVALARWRDTSGRFCLPAWELARAEVMSRAELDRECDITGVTPVPVLTSEDRDAEMLLEVAFRDPLTGVATQALFSDCVERALAQGPVVGRFHALLLVELDSMGATMSVPHPPTTDQLLAAAAPQLVATVREADVTARLMGDQFGVLLRNVTPVAADAVAARIVERVRVPVSSSEPDLTTGTTVGVALSHPHQTRTELVQEAAAALLIAKWNGGSCSVSFSPATLVSVLADVGLAHVVRPPQTPA